MWALCPAEAKVPNRCQFSHQPPGLQSFPNLSSPSSSGLNYLKSEASDINWYSDVFYHPLSTLSPPFSLFPSLSQIYYLRNDLYSCGIGSVRAAMACQACWVGSDWAALFVLTLQTDWHAGDFFPLSFTELQHAKTPSKTAPVLCSHPCVHMRKRRFYSIPVSVL